MVKKLILQKNISFGAISLNSDSPSCFCCFLDLTMRSRALQCNALHVWPYAGVNHWIESAPATDRVALWHAGACVLLLPPGG